MVIFKKAEGLIRYLLKIKEKGGFVSFVPTMGALHTGHISLLNEANGEGVTSVVSIFVNPTQFNDKSDYEQYPITIDEDITELQENGCDVLFLPSVTEMYPDGDDATPSFDFGYLETILEGAHRPGHFKGVGQVVGRFLDIVQPDKMYIGQKDYQQCMVLTSLIKQKGLQDKVQVVICDTKRAADGLALSSRNKRLTDPQRNVAGTIYQCLVSIRSKAEDGNFKVVHKESVELLEAKGFVPDYVALADANTLELLDEYDSDRKMVALIAAKIGSIRLIDNMLLN
ncbi:MAG: pantoate--beta-alanine ligase [Chitinophagales bacterium]|nr:pantoate--beta-alanine ligase [Chitinophagaceae bacterium]MCB9065085.1 pantoate--beta-alanine ligase [Chitinophagales bacterium]